MLEFKNITKTFPGTRALSHVSFHARAGEVLVLLGENGAGKSTLMKILSGVWPVSTFEGEFSLDGKPCQFASTRDAMAVGIAMIHQELSVFGELTVGEHLALDQLPRVIDWRALHRKTQAFLDHAEIPLNSKEKVKDLSMGGKQLVEIARALYRDARVIVFDEPTSALTHSEVVLLEKLIDELRAQGRIILYITHRMDEVFRLADRMVVLRDGQFVGVLEKGARSELEPQIIRMMVGRSVDTFFPVKNTSLGKVRLTVKNLSVSGSGNFSSAGPVSFEVRAGEVLGLAGLLGAGRSEIMAGLFGAAESASGAMQWDTGEKVDLGKFSPRAAMKNGIAWVTEDRKGNGLVLPHSVQDNFSLPALGQNRLPLSKRRAQTETAIEKFRIKCWRPDQRVGDLSGGNQQKVILSKWLETEPRLLLLDEPTRGIDVGAKAEIYEWIQRLATTGMSIIVASSEMPELLGLCHRVLVVRLGQISAELPGATTQEEIMKAASL